MKREDTIGFRVRDLSNAIKRLRPCAQDSAEAGIEGFTRVQGWVIGYLYEHREADVYQRDMEKQFSVSRPTMTEILKSMEKNGLIMRTHDESDARLKKISLTDKSLALHEEHERMVERFEAQMRKGVSDAELKAFFATIQKLKANITNEQ